MEDSLKEEKPYCPHLRWSQTRGNVSFTARVTAGRILAETVSLNAFNDERLSLGFQSSQIDDDDKNEEYQKPYLIEFDLCNKIEPLKSQCIIAEDGQSMRIVLKKKDERHWVHLMKRSDKDRFRSLCKVDWTTQSNSSEAEKRRRAYQKRHSHRAYKARNSDDSYDSSSSQMSDKQEGCSMLESSSDSGGDDGTLEESLPDGSRLSRSEMKEVLRAALRRKRLERMADGNVDANELDDLMIGSDDGGSLNMPEQLTIDEMMRTAALYRRYKTTVMEPYSEKYRQQCNNANKNGIQGWFSFSALSQSVESRPMSFDEFLDKHSERNTSLNSNGSLLSMEQRRMRQQFMKHGFDLNRRKYGGWEQRNQDDDDMDDDSWLFMFDYLAEQMVRHPSCRDSIDWGLRVIGFDPSLMSVSLKKQLVTYALAIFLVFTLIVAYRVHKVLLNTSVPQ